MRIWNFFHMKWPSSGLAACATAGNAMRNNTQVIHQGNMISQVLHLGNQIWSSNNNRQNTGKREIDLCRNNVLWNSRYSSILRINSGGRDNDRINSWDRDNSSRQHDRNNHQEEWEQGVWKNWGRGSGRRELTASRGNTTERTTNNTMGNSSTSSNNHSCTSTRRYSTSRSF